MSQAYVALVLLKLLCLLFSLVSAKVGFTIFSKAGRQGEKSPSSAGSALAVTAWVWRPAEAAAPGKGAQGTLSASLAAAARRAYIDPRTSLGMAALPLEEHFKGLQGFKLAGLQHGEIRYCSYFGKAQHSVWANWKWFTFFFSKQNFISGWHKAFCSITTKCFRLLVWRLLL